MGIVGLCVWIAIFQAVAGCGNKPRPNPVSPPVKPPAQTAVNISAGPPKAEPDSVTFTDITEQAGLNFTHYTGAKGRMYFPEAQVPGCAFFDYNNDGRPDILVTNMTDWAEVKSGRRHTHMVLYRNDGNCHFTDVTHAAGLDIEMYGQGVAAADYDNDGWQDLYITCVL